MELHKNISGAASPSISQKQNMPGKKRSIFEKVIVSPYLWILPSLLLMFVVTFIPIIELFLTSMSKISLAGIRKGFYGLNNYNAIFSDPTFYMVMKNTLIWTVFVVGISTVASMGIALLLNQKFPGRRIVRAALIVPWSVSLIITAAIWKWILDYNYGTLNYLLMKLNIVESGIYWLADPSLSFPAMIGVGIFVTLPFTSFVILSGLQSISYDMYEAASVDGADGSKRFFYITLPLLKQPLMISLVLNTIYVFNSFPIIWTMTQGDPVNKTDTVITYLYKLAFKSNSMGEAAAVSVISFLILLTFTIIYVYSLMREE